MSFYKIIAIDLDGTVLNSDKELTDTTREALQKAAETGIEIVPTTGRFFDGMPKIIRELPFINYAITINGAELLDIKNQKVLRKAEMPYKYVVEILQILDFYDCIYDCYIGGWGYATEKMKKKVALYAPDEHMMKMLIELRDGVPELKEYILNRKQNVQKIMVHVAKNLEHYEDIKEILRSKYKDILIASSAFNNMEINDVHANKGDALIGLADYLGCTVDQTMAFGDAANDKSMILKAGKGIVMENGTEEMKQIADYITDSNDNDGVAKAIYKFCF